MIDRSLAAQTRAIYERHAAAFDQHRSRGLPEDPTCGFHTICLAARA